MAPETNLGTVTATYPTDNARRGRLAAVLLLAGVAVSAAGVAFWVVVDDRGGRMAGTAGDPLLLPSAVLGLGFGLLLLGVALGSWFLIRRGEVFELHENGVRCSRAGRSVSITWADVERVDVRRGKDTALARWAGGDLGYTIHCADGRKITVTGLTRDARGLLRHVEAATRR
ncbi:hypothetical protein [Prauserella flavalba]|uniref:PH domain-containing protein n=1 Tax=Prauserella flavalba TaxID=1477506 RepID=A0A318LP71_9PSEU|nr:hypothetical protein [Prauserella flavalba]PXY36356.1 hypothetical protein BA062_13165 [Prauserella flavalba]